MPTKCETCGWIAAHAPGCPKDDGVGATLRVHDIQGPPGSGNPETPDWSSAEFPSPLTSGSVSFAPGHSERVLLMERVKLVREGGDVERCHAHPHLGSYSVGHHSFSVALLLTLCWQAAHGGALPRAELITAALLHDVPERITGDVPQPVKHLLGERMEMVDARVEAHILNLGHLDHAQMLKEEELEYLRAADKVELYLWSLEQARLGNAIFLDWVRDYDAYFTQNPPPWPFVVVMVEGLNTQMSRIPYPRLKEISGL